MMRALLMTLLLTGCAASPACQKPAEPHLVAQLFLGRAIPDGGVVDGAAFLRFTETEITPRFPDGFTLVDAAGYWRGADNRTIREPSTLLQVVAADTAATRERLDAIAHAYQTRFRQESVGKVLTTGCAVF
jgi:hypothetical protein